MKTFIPIIIGLVVIIAGWNLFGPKSTEKEIEVTASSTVETTSMVMFNGEVASLVDPTQVVEYSFAIPEEATTELLSNNALVRVTNNSAPYASLYFSYNVGRNYTALDYINKVISPKVKVVNPLGEAMIGNTMWYKANSDHSEWHVAAINDGKWIVVVESPKDLSGDVQATLSTFIAQ